jgi:hypothetical protein
MMIKITSDIKITVQRIYHATKVMFEGCGLLRIIIFGAEIK